MQKREPIEGLTVLPRAGCRGGAPGHGVRGEAPGTGYLKNLVENVQACMLHMTGL